jgi:hypothetical protein
MSNAQPPPPGQPPPGQPQVNVAGPIQNFIYGSHVVGDQTSTALQSSVYGKVMAAHGVGYWLLHFIVAFGAAALLELALRLIK